MDNDLIADNARITRPTNPLTLPTFPIPNPLTLTSHSPFPTKATEAFVGGTDESSKISKKPATRERPAIYVLTDDPSAIPRLFDGDAVEFAVVSVRKGRPHAVDVFALTSCVWIKLRNDCIL